MNRFRFLQFEQCTIKWLRLKFSEESSRDSVEPHAGLAKRYKKIAIMESDERRNRRIKVKQFKKHSSTSTKVVLQLEIDSETFIHKKTIETNIKRDYRNVIKTKALLN